MRISKSKVLIAAVVVAAVALVISFNAEAKKKDEGPKKVVAIGNVNTGGMGFSSMTPQQLSELFRVRAKKRLQKSGNFTVILPEPKDIAKQAEDKPQKVPTTAAAAMRQAQEMQKQFQLMQMQSQGQHIYYPVDADVLVDFNIQTGSSSMSTGGTLGQIGSWTGTPSLGDADFSSDSINMTLTCLLRSPKTGSLQDEYKAKASSTKATRVGGMSYYTMENTSNPDRAFDRMFKRAMNKCVNWIEKQL